MLKPHSTRDSNKQEKQDSVGLQSARTFAQNEEEKSDMNKSLQWSQMA